MTLHHDIAGVTSQLRDARDVLGTSRARIEQAAIDQAGGTRSLGANDDDRQRKLALVLAGDETYRHHLLRVRHLEAQLDTLNADLAAINDERRATEWAIRSQLAQVLGHATIDQPADDAVQDQLVDLETERRARQPEAPTRKGNPLL